MIRRGPHTYVTDDSGERRICGLDDGEAADLACIVDLPADGERKARRRCTVCSAICAERRRTTTLDALRAAGLGGSCAPLPDGPIMTVGITPLYSSGWTRYVPVSRHPPKRRSVVLMVNRLEVT